MMRILPETAQLCVFVAGVYRQLHNTNETPPRFYYRTDTNRRQYIKGFRAKLTTRAARESGEEVYDGLNANVHPLDSSFEAEQESDDEDPVAKAGTKTKKKKSTEV